MCTSQASVSRERCPLALGSQRTGGFVNAVLSVFSTASLVFSKEGSRAGWSFCKHLFSGAAFLTKFVIKRQKTLHSLRKDLSFDRDVDI